MNISFDKQNLPTTSAMIAAVVILLGSLVFAVWPQANVEKTLQSLKKQANDAELAGHTMKEQTEAENKVSQSLTWSGTGNEIGPTAYANLNKIATGLNVKIINFRPQREINSGDISQLPFTINVTGTYGNVLAFVHKIETTPSKLAVELLQLGASDDSSDNVTGTVGVEAYVLNAATDSSSSAGATSKKGSKAGATGSKATKGPSTTISAREIPKTEKKKDGH